MNGAASDPSGSVVSNVSCGSWDHVLLVCQMWDHVGAWDHAACNRRAIILGVLEHLRHLSAALKNRPKNQLAMEACWKPMCPRLCAAPTHKRNRHSCGQQIKLVDLRPLAGRPA